MAGVLDDCDDDNDCLWEEHDDSGLPDAAFTEDELAAGVQHIVRTGDPNAMSSDRRFYSSMADDWDEGLSCNSAGDDVEDDPIIHFESYAEARTWALANPGSSFRRLSDRAGFAAVKPPHKPKRDLSSISFRQSEIKTISPRVHEVLCYPASPILHDKVRGFNREAWHSELLKIDGEKLSYLDELLCRHISIERSRITLIRYHMGRRGCPVGIPLLEPIAMKMSKFLDEIRNDVRKELLARHSE